MKQRVNSMWCHLIRISSFQLQKRIRNAFTILTPNARFGIATIAKSNKSHIQHFPHQNMGHSIILTHLHNRNSYISPPPPIKSTTHSSPPTQFHVPDRLSRILQSSTHLKPIQALEYHSEGAPRTLRVASWKRRLHVGRCSLRHIGSVGRGNLQVHAAYPQRVRFYPPSHLTVTSILPYAFSSSLRLLFTLSSIRAYSLLILFPL